MERTFDTERRNGDKAMPGTSPKPPPYTGEERVLFDRTTVISRILVPVDLSARSLAAATYAGSLAAEFGSELVFLHAVRNRWPLGPEQREIRDIIARTGAHRFLFREGSPAPVILGTAEAQGSDLILMPTRGKPALKRLYDGSITAQVLRGAHCPVWVCQGETLPVWSRPIRTILCGLSLGPRASAVLRWSARLADRFNARLSVFHACEALASIPGLPCEAEWRSWLKEAAGEDIRKLQIGAGTQAEVWLEAGKPISAIPRIAGCVQPDLLVIGKSPRKRFFGDLRTLSYRIACRAPCPLASV